MLPDFPGIELFKGKILHSHSYRVPYPFKDQKVLIVGAGNSACEIASELSNHCQHVLISSRSGTWILPKFTLFGLPTDQLNSRAVNALPRSVLNFALESMSKLYTGDISKLGLKASHHVLEAHPTLNSDILGKINSGKVVMKPNIKCFLDSNSIEFDDGTVQKVDVVLYCTGYKIENSFLDSETVLGQIPGSNRVLLYKHIFPISFSNIAFIGLVQPLGSILPVSEMQARWAARVFAGEYVLPLSKEMRGKIFSRLI